MGLISRKIKEESKNDLGFEKVQFISFFDDDFDDYYTDCDEEDDGEYEEDDEYYLSYEELPFIKVVNNIINN